jgi:selenocysteine lyase/cysteine desulfurase
MACQCAYGRRLAREFQTRAPASTVYLDYAATTPVDPRVLGVYERACRSLWANPASLHAAGINGIKLIKNNMTMLKDKKIGRSTPSGSSAPKR